MTKITTRPGRDSSTRYWCGRRKHAREAVARRRRSGDSRARRNAPPLASRGADRHRRVSVGVPPVARPTSAPLLGRAGSRPRWSRGFPNSVNAVVLRASFCGVRRSSRAATPESRTWIFSDAVDRALSVMPQAGNWYRRAAGRLRARHRSCDMVQASAPPPPTRLKRPKRRRFACRQRRRPDGARTSHRGPEQHRSKRRVSKR
jgi:hypothetical protein